MKLDNITSNFIWAYNGKFGGGGMVLSPLSVVNDGYLELFYVESGVPVMEVFGFFEDVKDGGQ